MDFPQESYSTVPMYVGLDLVGDVAYLQSKSSDRKLKIFSENFKVSQIPSRWASRWGEMGTVVVVRVRVLVTTNRGAGWSNLARYSLTHEVKYKPSVSLTADGEPQIRIVIGWW